MKKYLLTIALLFTITNLTVKAQMSSLNYQIPTDSLNTGGGEDGRSISYNLADTLGEMATGLSNSENYDLHAGFRQSSSDFLPLLSFSISANTLELQPNPLSVHSVSLASHHLNITTNAPNGYYVHIIKNTDFQTATGAIMADVSDGEVTAGEEEYGFRTNGPAGQMNLADVPLLFTPQIIAQSNSAVNNHQVTVTYKSSISPITEAGNYTQIITLMATGNF